jgi:DNA repair protein RecO (recombination protein O)
MAVLSFYAEVIDEALPERDPQETVFRLLARCWSRRTR